MNLPVASGIAVTDSAADHEVAATGKPMSRIAHAYEAVQEAIVEGRYKPDERLTEIGLAQSLGVSRSTLRAALVRLHYEGYLTLEPNRGAKVRAFTPTEAIEILQVRETLEAMAASLAAVNAFEDELAVLESIVVRMADVVDHRDRASYQRLNREFHATVVTASRNITLARTLAATRYPLVMGQFRSLASTHPRAESLKEHRAILVALRARDASAAERMMRLHVSAARNALTIADANRQVEAYPED
jgi:DNA-binding GntR family transcriptional regulator